MADSLIENQFYQHGLIARVIENYNKLSADRKTKFTVESRLQLLETYWAKFETNHERLLDLVTGEDRKKKDYFKQDLYQTCVEDYLQAKSDLLAIHNNFVTIEEQSTAERRQSRNVETTSGG